MPTPNTLSSIDSAIGAVRRATDALSDEDLATELEQNPARAEELLVVAYGLAKALEEFQNTVDTLPDPEAPDPQIQPTSSIEQL